MAALDDSSYSAAGEALNALGRIDSVAALAAARARVGLHCRGTLAEEIVGTLAQFGSEEDFEVVVKRFALLSFKPRIVRKFVTYLGRVRSTAKVEKGVNVWWIFGGGRSFLDRWSMIIYGRCWPERRRRG
jgi:aminopeptidase N